MRCDHTLLRRTTKYPWSSDSIWECVDCSKVFDIEEIKEEEK